MTLTEVAALLTLCSRYDLRTVGEEDVRAWHDILYDLPSTDAILAVRRWYAEHHDRIMPGDVRQLVRQLRRERHHQIPDTEPPDADPADPRAYIQALRARRTRDVGALRQRDLSRLAGCFRAVQP